MGGFAAPFLGPLSGTETEAGRSGGTLFGCQILGSVLGPQTLPTSRFHPVRLGPGSSPTLPCAAAPMAGDGVLADFSIFETEA